mgnify:CR=1 FL=1
MVTWRPAHDRMIREGERIEILTEMTPPDPGFAPGTPAPCSGDAHHTAHR